MVLGIYRKSQNLVLFIDILELQNLRFVGNDVLGCVRINETDLSEVNSFIEISLKLKYKPGEERVTLKLEEVSQKIKNNEFVIQSNTHEELNPKITLFVYYDIKELKNESEFRLFQEDFKKYKELHLNSDLIPKYSNFIFDNN